MKLKIQFIMGKFETKLKFFNSKCNQFWFGYRVEFAVIVIFYSFVKQFQKCLLWIPKNDPVTDKIVSTKNFTLQTHRFGDNAEKRIYHLSTMQNVLFESCSLKNFHFSLLFNLTHAFRLRYVIVICENFVLLP